MKRIHASLLAACLAVAAGQSFAEDTAAKGLSGDRAGMAGCETSQGPKKGMMADNGMSDRDKPNGCMTKPKKAKAMKKHSMKSANSDDMSQSAVKTDDMKH